MPAPAHGQTRLRGTQHRAWARDPHPGTSPVLICPGLLAHMSPAPAREGEPPRASRQRGRRSPMVWGLTAGAWEPGVETPSVLCREGQGCSALPCTNFGAISSASCCVAAARWSPEAQPELPARPEAQPRHAPRRSRRAHILPSTRGTSWGRASTADARAGPLGPRASHSPGQLHSRGTGHEPPGLRQAPQGPTLRSREPQSPAGRGRAGWAFFCLVWEGRHADVLPVQRTSGGRGWRLNDLPVLWGE